MSRSGGTLGSFNNRQLLGIDRRRVLLLDCGPGRVPHISGCFEPLQEQRCRVLFLECITHRIEASRYAISEGSVKGG